MFALALRYSEAFGITKNFLFIKKVILFAARISLRPRAANKV